VVLAAAALGVAGCGGGSPEAEHAEAAEESSGGAVPQALADTESGAEDLIAFALAGDRRAVVSSAGRLVKEVDGTTTRVLSRASVRAATVAELERRTARLSRVSRARSFVDVALAANAVSQLMPRLYERFESPVPSEILGLDYLDREAQFRSLARQPTKVAAAVKSLAATWARVRPKVVSAGGTDEARAYQAHVDRMARLAPSAAHQIEAEARSGLEVVDRLERVFTD